MERKLDRWLTSNTIKYIKYIPAFILKIKNWPFFLFNYIGCNNKGGTYYFRSGVSIQSYEGTASGTIAVVFFRKHYGSVQGMKNIIEIGANIGVFTIYAASQEKNVVIYAYEPIKDNYDLLSRNITLNSLNNQVKSFNLGIASTAGKKTFYLINSVKHTITSSHEKASSITLDCITLQDIFTNNKIDTVDLLKMNCEGAEYEIFYNTPQTYLKKINEIRMEFHNVDNNRNNVQHLVEFLELNGFSKTNLCVNATFPDSGFLWMKNNNL
jgi:FkbM family methyltransferase